MTLAQKKTRKTRQERWKWSETGSSCDRTPTNSDNDLLTAEEIFKLKLNAELVVLSACDTGRGRITGDGVIGLSRSLFIVGTLSVIVSLCWGNRDPLWG